MHDPNITQRDEGTSQNQQLVIDREPVAPSPSWSAPEPEPTAA